MAGKARLDIGHERLMLMAPDRVFYLGLLGTPSQRKFGSLTVYASLHRPFRICLNERCWRRRRLAVVPPYVSHRIETSDPMIGSIMIEPESIEFSSLPEALNPMSCEPGDPPALARIQPAFASLQKIAPGATTDGIDADRLFMGQSLANRTLDARVAMIIDKIKQDPTFRYTAEECAAQANLSFSRFLHLFKAEVGVAFRKFRAWKRARSLLYHVNRRGALTDIALEVGYPDSTHFSHSVRQVYGLQPKEIFAGSRRLAILRHDSERIPTR